MTDSAQAHRSHSTHSIPLSGIVTKSRSVRPLIRGRIRSWAMWSLPRRVLIYVLVVEALTVLVLLGSVAGGITVAPGQWAQFLVLTSTAHLYQWLSRAPEERRRAKHGSTGLNADFTSAFTYPAAALLPLSLAVALIVTLRLARYPIARKAPYRYILSTASMLLAACTVHGLRGGAVLLDGWHGATQIVLACGGVLYIVQQIVTVGIAAALSADTGRPPWSAIVGDKEHLADAAMGIAIGIGVAAATATPLAAALALFLALAISQLVRHRESGRRDSGTGLLTKSRWRALGEAKIGDVVRSGRGAAVLVVDLDFFKSVNDTWGHLVGDLMLAEVATVLTRATRSGDIAARYGGEEFVVLLIGEVDHASASTTAERIRCDISNITLVFEKARGGEPVILTMDEILELESQGVAVERVRDRTASLGVGVIEPGDPVPDSQPIIVLGDLLSAADAAVYEAKAGGRNKVIVTSIDPQDGTSPRAGSA